MSYWYNGVVLQRLCSAFLIDGEDGQIALEMFHLVVPDLPSRGDVQWTGEISIHMRGPDFTEVDVSNSWERCSPDVEPEFGCKRGRNGECLQIVAVLDV